MTGGKGRLKRSEQGILPIEGARAGTGKVTGFGMKTSSARTKARITAGIFNRECFPATSCVDHDRQILF
jgi:hypothetical protein